MKKSIVLTVLCLALGVSVTACGSDSKKSSDKPATSNAPAGKANVKKVEMKNIQFVPMDVTVQAGNTIQWTNNDRVPHTVTKGSGPGPAFDSKSVNPGQTYERNFPDKGTINYVCTIHPNQKGTITVQ